MKYRAAAAVCSAIALASSAHAGTLTVGVFAPTAPFSSTAARVELASRLAEHLGKALGVAGTGKVFARGADFTTAVSSGEVTVALVDASFLAVAGGNYTVLAGSVSNGDTVHGWQVVARGATKLSALRGKRVLVPAIGGHEIDFVLNALFGGEVGRDFFAKIEVAPDTVSALAALGLGKVDAAIVPSGSEPPAGASVILKLPAISGPVLVAYGSATGQRAALTEAALAFQGDAVISGFRASDAGVVHSITARLTRQDKRGPFAVPAFRLLVTDLLEGRTFSIERTPASTFAIAPDSR